jgi:hypothetical protein
MHVLNENAADPRSALMRLLVPAWEYSRPRFSAHVHFAIGAVLVAVTILVLFLGYWWGALLPLAAALHFWLGYYDRTVAASAPPRAGASRCQQPVSDKRTDRKARNDVIRHCDTRRPS